MKIAIVYESKKYILDNFPGKEDYLYHWREVDEIDAIKEALKNTGHEVILCDGLEDFIPLHTKNPIDLAWNLSIRVKSRNRTALGSSLFEILKVPYTGSDATAKILCLNKDLLKPLLLQSNILTPNYYVVDHENEFVASFDQFIVKPVCEGYSLGLKKFTSTDDKDLVKLKLKEIREQLNCKILIEEFIPGQEVTLAFIEKQNCFSAIKCEIGDEDILSLTDKRFKDISKTSIDPSSELMSRLKREYDQIRKHVGYLGYGTIDFRISKDSKIYTIDVNADATLHPKRSFAHSFQMIGMSYQDIINNILNTEPKTSISHDRSKFIGEATL